jgi:leucyl aminopeptidase
MHVPYEVPRFSVSGASIADADVDLIIIPVAQDHEAAAASRYDGALGEDLKSALDRGEFHGKANEVYVARTPASGWRAPRIVFVGGGPRAEIDVERIRRMVISAVQTARSQRRARVGWADLEPGAIETAARIETAAEAFVLANFDNGIHKSRDGDQFFIREGVIFTSGSVTAAVTNGGAMGESINAARVLINEPGNYLTPRVLAEKAASLASVPGITAEILDERKIEELGMGLLLGVARGSIEPPRLLVLRYSPAGAPVNQTLGLVGKGITFDTGGISIKPADNMDKMKDDMSGGAAVICAMSAIARLKAPVRVVAIVPMTENMPGGKAVKPGDILTSAAGKTVEIINTDAEGRLVLGDGLWYARELGATHLVDVATLTGACVVALGKTTTGLFGAPDQWVEAVRRASVRAGDRSWPMPVFDDYKDQLKSEIADFTNTGGRPGGAITAALFLKEFTGDLPWVHMDIAGTAWAEEAKPYQPKGATGVGVRTLVELALDAATWSAQNLKD